MPIGDDTAPRPESGTPADTVPKEYDIADDISGLSPIHEERDRSRSVHGDPNEGKPKSGDQDGTDVALQLLAVHRLQKKKKAEQAKKERHVSMQLHQGRTLKKLSTCWSPSWTTMV